MLPYRHCYVRSKGIPIVEKYDFLGITVKIKKNRGDKFNFDTINQHSKERATKLAVRVKQLQRFLRTPHILRFTVMKVRRLIASVFVGCLYGIQPKSKGKQAGELPKSLGILRSLYHKTLKVAFRIENGKSQAKTVYAHMGRGVGQSCGGLTLAAIPTLPMHEQANKIDYWITRDAHRGYKDDARGGYQRLDPFHKIDQKP